MINLLNTSEPLYQKLQTTDVNQFKQEAIRRYGEWRKTTEHECQFLTEEKWMNQPEKKCFVCHSNFNEAETGVENDDQTENSGFYWSKNKKHCSLDGEYRIYTCSLCNFQACHACRQIAIDKPFDLQSLGEPLNLPSETKSIGQKLKGNTDNEDWIKEAKKRIHDFRSKDANHNCNFDIVIDWGSEASKITCNICCFNHYNLYDEDMDDEDYYWTDSGYWDEHEKYNKYYNGTLYVCSGCKIRMCFACREVFN